MEILIVLALIVGAFFLLDRKSWRHDTPPSESQVVEPLRPRPSPAPINRPPPPVAHQGTRLPQEEVVFGRAYVTDGDGLRIKGEEIRLFGIDAPEFNHPFGKKAKWALLGLCKGQDVMAIAAERDNHDRLVARCFLADGRDLSAEMVKLGLALDWPKFSGAIYDRFEPPDVRKKLWLADARQKGRIDVWKKFEAQQQARNTAKAH